MVLQEYIGEIIIGFGSAFVTWIFARKKEKIEIKAAEADAVSRMQETYDKFVQDFTHNYEYLHNEVVHLEEQVNKWKQKYQSLKTEFENYKKLKQ